MYVSQQHLAWSLDHVLCMGSNKVWPTSKGCLNGKYQTKHFVTHLTSREPHKTLVSVQLYCRSWWYMLNDVQNYDYVDKLWLYRWTINIAETCLSLVSFPDPIWEQDWPHSHSSISQYGQTKWMQGEHATRTEIWWKANQHKLLAALNSCSQTVRMAEDPLLTIASSYSCSIELAQKFECINCAWIFTGN